MSTTPTLLCADAVPPVSTSARLICSRDSSRCPSWRWLLPRNVHTVWSLVQPSSIARRSETSALCSRPRWCNSSPRTPWFGPKSGSSITARRIAAAASSQRSKSLSVCARLCHGCHSRGTTATSARSESLGCAQAAGAAQHVGVVVVEAEAGGRRRSDTRLGLFEEIDGRVEVVTLGEDRTEQLRGAFVARLGREHAAERLLGGRGVTGALLPFTGGQQQLDRNRRRGRGRGRGRERHVLPALALAAQRPTFRPV